MRRTAVLLGVMVGAAACGPGLAGGLFTRGALAYRVVEPTGDWRRVGFDDNDLAWLSARTGHVLAVNATCQGHEDPSLEVLTNHLLLGFTERELVARKLVQLDGREGLRSRYVAKLDGVPTSLELVVLKKNGCVHDFTYVSPRGGEATHQAQFDALVAGFKQERAP